MAKEQFSSWENDVRECSDVASVYGAPALEGSDEHQACAIALLYGKGPYVMHALRSRIGDDAFFKVLNIFTRGAARNHLKATTEDLIQIVNAVTKANHREFFDRYVYGTEVHDLGQ